MQVTIKSDYNSIVATLQPQPSRASLRKRRIRHDKRGYIDIPFFISLTNGAFVNKADLQVTSDSNYPLICNISVTVYDINRTYSYGSAVITVPSLWRVGERVSFGDSIVPSATDYSPIAAIINQALLQAPIVNGNAELTAVLRVEFDREDFSSWDRGFFVKPAEDAPSLVLDVNDVAFSTQGIFIAVEDTIPSPSLQGIYLFGCDFVLSDAHVFMLSAAFDDRDILISGYGTVYTSKNLFVKSTDVVVKPPDPVKIEYTYYSQRDLYWSFIPDGSPDSEMDLYFPCTDAETASYYINGYTGSDDYTVQEIQNINTPMRSIDAFFDTPANTAINDADNLYIDGSFTNTLVFKMNLVSLSPSTPIMVGPSDTEEGSTIYGHLACESGNCVTNPTFENFTFYADSSITTSMSGTTQSMIYLTFCDPKKLVNSDPYYRAVFKNCSFFLPKTFENNVDAMVSLDLSLIGVFPVIVVFDTCLIGVDGVGSINTFLRLNRGVQVTVLFRNCTFANPFGKGNPTTVGGSTPDSLTYANCAFWNFNYSSINSALFQRCYNGDPQFVSDLIGSAQFGKLQTTSPCYRQWMPGYGMNIGWDQTEPIGIKYFNSNITAYASVTKNLSSSIVTKFDIRDKFFTNLSTAFVKLPYIMDTTIITKFAEAIAYWATEIPNVKTSVARLTTELYGSLPLSIDILPTEILLLKYPVLANNIKTIKETIPDAKVLTEIETTYDTQCPLLLRYGFPDWWEPVMGSTLYYFFDVFDNGTGIDLSTLLVEFNGKSYQYGDPELYIEPLMANKTAFRILFNPGTTVFAPESIQDIKITVADCVRNWGPIWDNRKADEVLHWGGLTDVEKRLALVPCNFSIPWVRDPFYYDEFERFAAPRRNTYWNFLYSDSWEQVEAHDRMTTVVSSDSFEDFVPYNQAYMQRYLDWTPYYVDSFWEV